MNIKPKLTIYLDLQYRLQTLKKKYQEIYGFKILIPSFYGLKYNHNKQQKTLSKFLGKIQLLAFSYIINIKDLSK